MKKQEIKKDKQKAEGNKPLPGYLLYPGGDDIYELGKEEQDIDPENISEMKTPNDETPTIEREELDFDDMTPGMAAHRSKRSSKRNEKDFDEDMSGRDLDVPGSELDDDLEDNGDEDEENNSYSIGGDRHEDLEEDKGG
jgi:hypothetical protein